MPSKATSLKEAMNILDPEWPLSTNEDLDAFFVPRAASPLGELRLLLTDSTTPQKILFTGHRGSGKSTELAKLANQLGGSHFIVHYSVKSVLNLFDLSYVDVLLSLGLELIRQVTARKINIRDDVLEHIRLFTSEVTKEVETGVKAGASISSELNAFVAKLTGKLTTEAATRETVREKVSHRLSDLLESIDLLAREAEKSTGQRMLVIVEDLDKTDLETARTLFYNNAQSLQAPPVSVIYTFPTALRHDNAFMQIEQTFPMPCVLPNLKTRSRRGRAPGAGEDDEIPQLSEILTRRVKKGLFTTGALTELARLSGGIPRELIALARYACLDARLKERPVIDEEAVECAAQRKRRDYQVLLDSAQLGRLAEIHASQRVENDEQDRALLHNLSVLEYRNGDVWHDVHPLIEPLLPGDEEA